MPKGSTLDPHVGQRPDVTHQPPQAGDSLNLAAIRWYANRIENHAIGVYTACPTAIPQIRDAMLECLDMLAELDCTQAEGCPPGYHREGNMCVPD